MKICYVISTVNIAGGANRSLLDLLPYIKAAGHECTILACAHGSMEEAARDLDIAYKVIPFSTYTETDVPIKRVRRRAANIYGKYAIALFLQSERFDILHNNSLPTAAGMDAAAMIGIPYICHIRENIWNGLGMEFYCPSKIKSILRKASINIAISDFIAESYQGFEPAARFMTLNDGIRTDDYYCERKIFESDTIQIGMVGVINPQKGQKEAAKAVELLHESGYTNIEMDIIGDNGLWRGTRNYANDLKKDLKNRSIEYIHFIPSIESIENLRLQRSKYDINLICSNAAGLGRTTIESMLSGSLTIAANAGATPEILADKKYGLLYESGNASDLAKRIAYAVTHKDEMRQIANKAQLYARDRFSIDRYAEQVLSIYDQVLLGERETNERAKFFDN